jgi:hypothetical protein
MKNTFTLIALTLTVLLSAFESRAQLGTVATAQFSRTGGFGVTADHSLRLALGYVPTNTTSIFTQFTFHTNDVGGVFSVSQSSDPGFIGFLSGATNGILDFVRYNYAIGSGTGAYNESGGLSETSFFTSFPHGGNGIDLSGFQVQRIDLTLNSLAFNPNPGGFTDFSFNVTLSFIGVVPEPSAAAILGAGLLALLFRKRKL